MTRRLLARLAQCRAGVAAAEFALIAPAFMGFTFVIVEGGRMVWTQQVLQETAFSAVRCMALKATGCDSESATKTWAVAKARESRVTVAKSAIKADAAATCDGRAGMGKVTITNPWSASVGQILPAARASLVATACFPTSPAPA